MAIRTHSVYIPHETAPITAEELRRAKEQNEGEGCTWKKAMVVGLIALALLVPAIAIPAYMYMNNPSNSSPGSPISPSNPPISNPPNSPQSSPSISPPYTNPSRAITAFTSYTVDTPDRLEMSRLVAENQRSYCEDHDVEYLVFEENLAAPVLPYWSKIKGIIDLLKEKDSSEWIVWMDDDAIVTNPSIDLHDFILSHDGDDPNTHVIVTEDSMTDRGSTDLNTGVLFVRNSKFSRKFFKELWDKRKETVPGHSYTYGDCPNQQCLHEQQAMHDLLRQQPHYKQHVKIIPQRDQQGIGVNVFSRFSHYDRNRDMYLDYSADPYQTRYRSGDFIAQCTGLSTNGYLTKDSLRPYGTNYRLGCVKSLSKDAKRYKPKPKTKKS